MKQKPGTHHRFTLLCTIFFILLASCQPATEIPTEIPIDPTEPPPTKRPKATPVPILSSQIPDVIQDLNDRQLLSSQNGEIIWQTQYLTLTENNLGTVSWLPLDIAADNFVLYTEFTWDSSDAGETACGVTFRDNAQGTYYMSLVRKNGDGLLWLSLDDQWQASPSETYGNSLNSGNNEVNELILIADQERITLLVNGIIFYEATDYSLNEGSISFITGTALSGNTCTFENSWVWEIGEAPSAPQGSNPPESQHELYAGFTGRSEIPILLLHPSGERIGLTQDSSSSDITSVIWGSPYGSPIVLHLDVDGKPKEATVGEDIVLYSNYTDSTVDLTIVHPDGTRELVRSKLSSSLGNKTLASSSPSYFPVAFSIPNQAQLQQQGFWGYVDEGLFAFEIGACVSAGAAFAANLPAIAALAIACHSPILELKIREGKAENIDVGNLEEIQDGLDLYGCYAGHIMDCVNKLVRDMAETEATSNQEVSNIPPEPVVTKKKKYP